MRISDWSSDVCSSDLGEEDGFLHGGVAAADHHHVAPAIKEAVAGGAGADAEALEFLLALEAKPARLGAGGDDHRIRRIFVAAKNGRASCRESVCQYVSISGVAATLNKIKNKEQ